jgi:hypothetical protein
LDAGKKSRQLLEESDSEDEEALPPAKRGKQAVGGAKKATAGGKGKGKRKQPAKGAQAGKGGEEQEQPVEEEEVAAEAAAGPKYGSVKVRDDLPGV